jgi:hypothetical protein
MGDHLGEHHDLKGRRSRAQEVEGSILLVGLKQAVEADQGGEHGGNPEDRRADAGQEVEIGAERKGHQGDDHEEEHQPERAGAADARGELQVAGEQGEEGADHSSPLPGGERLGDPPSLVIPGRSAAEGIQSPAPLGDRSPSLACGSPGMTGEAVSSSSESPACRRSIRISRAPMPIG